MVDERDRYEGEEGEYHFSDEQLDFDETETSKKSVSGASVQKTIVDKLTNLSPARRMMLASVIFVSLIGLVYKMLLPSHKTPVTDIVQAAPAKPETVQPVVAVAPAPAPAPQATQVPEPTVPTTAATTLPAGGVPATQPYDTINQPTPPTQPTNVIPAGATSTAPQTINDRVKVVEDQNAAIMNVLQTDVAPKMTENENQANMLRGKIDDLAKRMNHIETSLSQISQMMQQQAAPQRLRNSASSSPVRAATEAGAMPVVRAPIPRLTYTVQAIIPGRAWLKADTGDTVTVAEGDTLRDYGRISKIDPYDGVVEIDTGSKVIALSYGMNTE